MRVEDCPHRTNVQTLRDPMPPGLIVARCELLTTDFGMPCTVQTESCERCLEGRDTAPTAIADTKMLRGLNARYRKVKKEQESLEHWNDCRYRGQQVGLRDCPTCGGNIKLKVFHCLFDEREVTIKDDCLHCKIPGDHAKGIMHTRPERPMVTRPEPHTCPCVRRGARIGDREETIAGATVLCPVFECPEYPGGVTIVDCRGCQRDVQGTPPPNTEFHTRPPTFTGYSTNSPSDPINKFDADDFADIRQAALIHQRGENDGPGGCSSYPACLHGQDTQNGRKCLKVGKPVSACDCNNDCPERMGTVTVSAIIVGRNEGKELHETIWSLWDETGVDEVVVVDDASNDGSTDVLVARNGDEPIATRTAEGIRVLGMPPITVVRNEMPLGCNAGRNQGAAAASSDVLVFLDSHMRISGQSLRVLAEQAVLQDGFVQPASRGLEFDTTFHCWGCDWKLGKHDEMPFIMDWKGQRPVGKFGQVDGMMGGCYVVPKTVFNRIGGVMGHAGCGLWGFSEELLSMKCALCDIPVLVARDISSRHWYRGKGEQGFRLPGGTGWRSGFAGLKIVLEPGTFRAMQPELSSREWNPELAAFLDSEDIRKEHEAFQAVRQHDDEWFFEKYIRHLAVKEE